MDETTKQKIALACNALLEKNAANDSQERERNSRGEPSTKKEAIEWLLNAAGELDVTLYSQGPRGSKERQQASEMLLEQSRWPDTTAAQAQEAGLALCYASPLYSEERKQAVQALIEITGRPGLSFEDAEILDNLRSGQASSRVLQRQQLTAKKRMWETIAQRPDLTSEQREEAVRAIEDYSSFLG